MIKVLKILIWLLLVSGLMVLLGFVVRTHGKSKCREVKILIDYPCEDAFITENDIRNYIAQLGDSVTGKPLSEIDIEKLELLIKNNPYVARVDVYATLDGIIYITVLQRKPIVRIQNKTGQGYYISEDGQLMGLNPEKPARVLVASGYIDEFYIPGLNLNTVTKDSALQKSGLYKIYVVSKFINRNEFLRAQTEQLYLNKEGEIELVPMVGEHLILLGDTTNLAEKFGKLIVFYQQGLPGEGWDKYDTINLKFQNQIVCTKKKSNAYGI